jgi:hypothetical protein
MVWELLMVWWIDGVGWIEGVLTTGIVAPREQLRTVHLIFSSSQKLQ